MARPKRLQSWLNEEAAQEEQPLTIELCWLPPNASRLDQLEIWFSILHRKLLRPNHLWWECLKQKLGMN